MEFKKSLRANLYLEDQNQSIVKLYFAGFPKGRVAYELKATQWVYEQGLPVAKPLGHVKRGNRYGLKLQFLQGTNLSDVLRRRPWMLIKYARQFANLHHQIHQYSPVNLTPQGYYLDLALRAAKRTFDFLPKDLDNYLPHLNDANGKLCHADFSPENVLLGKDKKMYVIDWADTQVGDPLYDVARCFMLINSPVSYRGKPLLIRMISKYGGQLFGHYYLKQYKKISDLDFKEFKGFELMTAVIRLNSNLPNERHWLPKCIKRLTR